MDIEWCELGKGTHLAAYDTALWFFNNLHTAVDYFMQAITVLGQTLIIFLPGNFTVPIVYLGENIVPELTAKRWRGIRLGFNSILGPVTYDLPFPYQTLQSLWAMFVAPIDYYLPYSETWPYVDDLDGQIRQGSACTPPKAFGILTYTPKLVGWGAIIYAVMSVLKALGLGSVVSKFISTAMSKSNLGQIADGLDDITKAVNQLDADELNNLKEGLDEVKMRLGVRLLLK